MPPEFLTENASGETGALKPEEKNTEVSVPSEKAGISSPKTSPQTPQKPLPTPEKVAKKFEPTWLKPLRTFKSDVSEAMQTGKGSLTRIVIAEKEREERRWEAQLEKNKGATTHPSALPPTLGKEAGLLFKKGVSETSGEEAPSRIRALAIPPHPIMFSEEPESVHTRFIRRNTIIIILSFLLAFMGIGAAYGAFVLLGETPGERPIEITQTIIATEKTVRISLEYLTEDELESLVRKEFANARLQAGQTEAIYFTKSILPGGIETPVKDVGIGVIGTRELFTIVKNKMPPNLLRSLNDQDFLFGMHSLSQNNPFLILKTDSFENALSGMLRWEPYIFDDLTPFFNINVSDRGSVSQIIFEDSVIKNNDARILKNNLGNVVFVYSFIDRETLVLTTNINTFDEVVSRLKTPKKILR